MVAIVNHPKWRISIKMLVKFNIIKIAFIWNTIEIHGKVESVDEFK